MFPAAPRCHSCRPVSGSAEAQWARAQAMGAAPQLRKLLQLGASSLFHWDYLKKTSYHCNSYDSRTAACFNSKLPSWETVCSRVVRPLQPAAPGSTRHSSPIRYGWEGHTETSWEHLGEAEAAAEGGFVTGPRNSHLGATEDRRRGGSGHLQLRDSAPLGSAPTSPRHCTATHWTGTDRLLGTVRNTILKNEENPTILIPTKQSNPATQADRIERNGKCSAAFELWLDLLTRSRVKPPKSSKITLLFH